VTGLSRSAWYVLMNEGEAPKPVPIGQRAVAWRSSDLQKWIEARKQQGAAQ
jgi:prophage regulatory protein